MKKYIKILITILALFLIVAIFSGCYNLFKTYYPEENLEVFSGRNYTSYEFSKKVAIITSNNNEDRFKLATDKGENWWYNSKTVLSGDFEKIGYNDDMLFILMDNTYYVFDISSYDVLDGKYEFIELSISEFQKSYPDYESFDWNF